MSHVESTAHPNKRRERRSASVTSARGQHVPANGRAMSELDDGGDTVVMLAIRFGDLSSQTPSLA
jgi:hypothetical protein